MTDIQSSDTETTPADLSRAIDNLEKNLDSISRSQRSGRATVLGGSLILLLMIVVFALRPQRTYFSGILCKAIKNYAFA